MEEMNCWETKFIACEYSDKLLTKLTDLNKRSHLKIDLKEVKKAIYYAKKYHGAQKRQTGEPFYSHPLEVAGMVANYLFRTDALVTSILHDTLEDTSLTFNALQSIFGIKVATQVEGLTRIQGDRKITSEELVKNLWYQKKYDMLFIKQMDRLHNLATIHVKEPEKIKKITNETLHVFLILSTYLGPNEIEKKFAEICLNTLAPQRVLKSPMPFGSDRYLLSLLNQNDKDHK